MSKQAPALLDFAYSYGCLLHSHHEINEEDLSRAFRRFTDQPPFPTEQSLRRACAQLGIQVSYLRDGNTTLRAANTWAGDNLPEIHLSRRLRSPLVERAIGHELRELIENAIRRTNADYEGLITHDNARMNPVSERFASALLMPEANSRLLVKELGFDLVLLSRYTDRSLPAVLVRMGEVLRKGVCGAAPRAVFWLFEAPWSLASNGKSTLEDLKAKYWAVLNGFPMRPGGPLQRYLALSLLPVRGRPVTDIKPLFRALAEGKPCREDFHGFAASEYDCAIIAEPIPFAGSAWRLLVCAVLQPDVHFLQGWMDRLNITVRKTVMPSPAAAPIRVPGAALASGPSTKTLAKLRAS